MIPITRFKLFIEAHSQFFTEVADNPDLAIGPKPVDADCLDVTYVVYQDENRNIQCQYEIGDRHYNRTEILRLIKRHGKVA